MGQPRKSQVSLEATPYYHVVSRCVRREFLCGSDPLTGRDYSHRRDWICQRLTQLVDVFAVDLCAYAVMSNHYHIVVRINEASARAWTPREVLKRWLTLFKGPAWMQEVVQSGDEMASHPAMSFVVAAYRARLMSLSWFMRCMNEPIARRANREDEVSGHFWQGRYRSQPLLDEGALMAAMAYVDLNPLRAGRVARPEAAMHCSISRRFADAAGARAKAITDPELLEFPAPGERMSADAGLGVDATVFDYLELIDWSGRFVSSRSASVIPANTPPILNRLGLSAEDFAGCVTRQGSAGTMELAALGDPHSLGSWVNFLGRSHVKGCRLAARMFKSAGGGNRCFSALRPAGHSQRPLPST